MNEKLLIVCGPTATGKTAIALRLAEKFNGELISADSRQVYKNMDIGTGKDLPKGSKIKYPLFGRNGYYQIGRTKVWGYDLVSPKSEFSVSQYLKFAGKTIGEIIKSGKLPILVGGTGLYIKGVIDGIPTVDIPRNPELRKNLEGRPADELYESLSQMDPIKAGSLNSSDRKNPRRLIRALEVASWQINHKKEKLDSFRKSNFDAFFVGLKAPKNYLRLKIEKRIRDRMAGGLLGEIRRLLGSKVSWDDQAMTSMGYGVFRDFFEGKRSEEETLKLWRKDEEKYADRQMVWFKKDKRVNWFDITDKKCPDRVEKSVREWYNSENAEKS